MPRLLRSTSAVALGFAIGSWIAAPGPARASCNVIPSTVKAFRGALGAIDRPFAMPGDRVTIEVDRADVDRLSVGLADVDGKNGLDVADVFVTLLFEPVANFAAPGSAPRHAVVLANDCARIDTWGRCAAGSREGLPCQDGYQDCGSAAIACTPISKKSQCESALAPSDDVTCVPVSAADMLLLAGSADPQSPDPAVIRFPFPDSDDQVGSAADDRTLAGPATIAVTRATSPLPCRLAAPPGLSQEPDIGRCAETGGLVACIDEIYRRTSGSSTEPSVADPDALSGPTPGNLHPRFPYFTALPKPNDFQALCDGGDDCEDAPLEVRFAVDTSGNALVPMDYAGIRREAGKLPLARIAQLTADIDAFPGGGPDPLRLPAPACPNISVSFVQSFSPQGHQVSPLVSPRAVRSNFSTSDLIGSIDAMTGVVRLQRRGVELAECVGGDAAGQPCSCAEQCAGGTCGGLTYSSTCRGGGNPGAQCNEDADCTGGGECGPSVFDATQFLVESGTGPGVLSDGEVALDLVDTVPLEGIQETGEVIAFAASERSVGADRNGDGDDTDSVVTLRDRESGAVAPIGKSGAPARALAVIRNGLSREPALATEDDLAAFLEPETSEGPCNSQYDCDRNGDHDVADTILRVYRILPGGSFDVLAGSGEAADAAPTIEGRPLRISDGLLFFRQFEWQQHQWTTTRVNRTHDDSSPDGHSNLCGASRDHRFVVFSSRGTNVVPTTDQNGTDLDLFLRDRDKDEDGKFDETQEVGAVATVIVGLTENDQQIANGIGCPATVSADGRYVAFHSSSPYIVSGDPYGSVEDIFVRDVHLGTTQRVSNGENDVWGNGDSYLLGSADRRWVWFASDASNLVDGDDNGKRDLFVRDRTNFVTTRVSVDPGDLEITHNRGAFDSDGRFAFHQGDDPAGERHVLLRDRATDGTEPFDEPGGTANLDACTTGEGAPVGGCSTVRGLSPEGRALAFTSLSEALVPGWNPFGQAALFVRDRDPDGDGLSDEPGETLVERADVSTDGEFATDQAGGNLSDDGRYLAFSSTASNLVPGDTNGVLDGFVRDRITGITLRASVAREGEQGGVSVKHQIANNGYDVLFESTADGFVPSDGNGLRDIFTRTIHGMGDYYDSILFAIDLRAPTPPIYSIGRIASVSVARGNMASVRRTINGAIGDNDVMLWKNRDPAVQQPLGRKGTEVVLADSDPADMHLAALLSEEFEANDWNGDGDQADTVVFTTPAPVAGGGTLAWSNSGKAGDSIAIAGTQVAFATRERDQGTPGNPSGADATGDTDLADRFVQVWDAAQLSLATIADTGGRRQPVQDYVWGDDPETLGDEILAFRSREGDFCNANAGAVTLATCGAPPGCASASQCDLNGDLDCCDDVMQAWDPAAAELHNSEMAVLPCTAESCDAARPYRVSGRNVTFLTFENKQGAQDLNENGSSTDLLLHTWTVPGSTSLENPPVPRIAGQTTSGTCSSDGTACTVDAECGGGLCIRPPGQCIRQVGGACTAPDEDNPVLCPGAQFCRASSCFEAGEPEDACRTDAECVTLLGSGARCEQYGNRRADEVLPGIRGEQAARGADGHLLFTGTGLCIQTLTVPCDPEAPSDSCEEGTFCGSGGTCLREHGPCTTSASCAAGACTFTDLITLGAADRDIDGVADPIDGCPEDPNPGQQDLDADGIGDACDAQTCGNDEVEGDLSDVGEEECDDGNRTNGDGCDRFCQLEGVADCGDTLDNDGDGEIDAGVANDPGCKYTTSVLENPQCDDGLDNDGDGLIDGALAPEPPGSPPRDDKCQGRWDNDEATNPPPSSCGIGVELLALGALLADLRRRRATRGVGSAAPG